MTRWGCLAVLGIVLLASVVAWWRHQAPTASFTSIRGERVALADLRGRPVLVTFWASDCRTCLLEIPEFDRLHRDYAPRGVRVVAVAMAYDPPGRVLSLVRDTGLGYTVVLDSDARLAAQFGNVGWVPTTFLIAPDGSVRQRMIGALDFGRLRQSLEDLLGDS